MQKSHIFTQNAFSQFYFYHCAQCKKITGSAHASNLFTDVDGITWTSGQQHIGCYQAPERDFSPDFCCHCGSGLPLVTKDSNRLLVPAGSLDSAPNIVASNNIFWAKRAPRYDVGLRADNCAGFVLP